MDKSRTTTDPEVEHLRAQVAALEQLLEVHERTTLAEADRAERAVADAQVERTRLSELFQQAPALIAVTRGPDHVFELANPLYLRVVGNRPLIGRPLREALPEIAEQGFVELLDGVYRSGEPYVGNEVHALVDRTGTGTPEEGYFNFVYQPLRELDGRVSGILTHAVEVTDQVYARQQVEQQAVELEQAQTELEMVNDELQTTNEELRDQEEQFRQLANSIPQLAWMADETGFIFWYNERWYEYTGTRPEDMEGWGWQSVHDPEALPHVLERWTASIRTGESFDMTFPLRGADGVFRPFLTRVVPIRDAAEKVVRWFGTNTDISEQRQAEEQQRFLAEASALFGASLSYETTLKQVANMAVPILADWCAADVLDPSGTLRRVAVAHPDPALVQVAQELEQRYPSDPDAPQGVPHVLRTGLPELVPDIPDELLAASARDDKHLQLLRQLGLRSYIVVPLIARGRTLGALTLVHAESGRRHDQADVRLAEELARRAAVAIDNARLMQQLQQALTEVKELATERNAILRQTADGVIVTDPNGTITFVNPAATRIHGVERLDVAPEDYSRTYHLFTLDGQPYPFEELPLARAVMREETVNDALWLIRRPDGTEVVAQGSAAPVYADDGAKLGAVLTLRDVTAEQNARAERERLLTELADSNAELDQFAYVVSHDLKAPLRGIANLSEWIEEDLDAVLTGDAREQMHLLRSRVRRMEGMINGILEYSRATRQQQRPEPVDTAALVAGVLDLLNPAPGVQIQVAPAMPVLISERLPLEQVFLNLIGNALKYGTPTEGEARITLQARDADSRVEFSVADNGPGIAEEHQETIFDIFQRLHTRDDVEGAGIGLSLVKKLVEARGGHVWVNSRPGAGTAFHFTWPKAADGAHP